jgi:hypothetical protein
MNTHSAPTLLDSNPGSNPSAGLPSLPAAPRRPARPLSLAATLATLAFAPFVDGAVVLSNLAGFSTPHSNDPYAIQGAGVNPAYEAVRVTTGPGSWTLNSVSVLAFFSTSARIQIWQGANPGSIASPDYVSIAQNTDADSGPPNYDPIATTFTFASTVTLTGGTDYWFALVPGPTSDPSWWYYNSSATPSITSGGWTRGGQKTYTTSWDPSSGRSYVSLAIDATQVPSAGVPDGTTTALLLAPLGLGLAWTSRRRGQAVRP